MNEFWTISAWSENNWKVIIWDNVMIGPFFYMISWDHWFKKWENFNSSNDWKSWDIIIWNNVWIWARVTILKWVEIWNNVVIWAWSVVTKNILSNSLAVWNPCIAKKNI
jgi:maltose O-acetyltransferase